MYRPLSEHPLSQIEWVSIGLLEANNWNPNIQLSPEFHLLKLSLMRQGWIQPILVARNAATYQIIDGFHRATLVKSDPEVAALTGGMVPCVVLELSLPERMLLTVRINRAKGSHLAVKMHDLVKALVEEHGLTAAQIATEIGGTKHEVETLLADNVFVALDTKNHTYSRAWTPKT